MENIDKKLIIILNYMINNKSTFEETATFFGIQKQELLNTLESNLDVLNQTKPKLLKQVKDKLEEEQKIESIAQFIIEKQVPIQKVADEFGISKSTVQKYINKKLIRISQKLYQEVKEAQNLVLQKGQVLGGKTGKRGPSITDFEALEMAENRIINRYTFEELEQIYSIPASTIHDALKRLDYPDTTTNLEKVTLINKNQKPRKTQIKADIEISHESRKK